VLAVETVARLCNVQRGSALAGAQVKPGTQKTSESAVVRVPS